LPLLILTYILRRLCFIVAIYLDLANMYFETTYFCNNIIKPFLAI
jgi:hypothetical protein